MGLPSNLYFWRDRSGNEVDLLIDKGLKLQPIEIKSGKTLNRDYFKTINRWHNLAGDEADDPILIYGGGETIKQGKVQVLSWLNGSASNNPFS